MQLLGEGSRFRNTSTNRVCQYGYIFAPRRESHNIGRRLLRDRSGIDETRPYESLDVFVSGAFGQF